MTKNALSSLKNPLRNLLREHLRPGALRRPVHEGSPGCGIESVELTITLNQTAPSSEVMPRHKNRYIAGPDSAMRPVRTNRQIAPKMEGMMTELYMILPDPNFYRMQGGEGFSERAGMAGGQAAVLHVSERKPSAWICADIERFRKSSRSPDLDFGKILLPIAVNGPHEEGLLSCAAGGSVKVGVAVNQITMSPVYLHHTLPSSGIPLKLEGSHDRTSHSSFHHLTPPRFLCQLL